MTDTKIFARKELTLEYLIDVNFISIASHYARTNHGKTEEDFMNEYFVDMWNDDKLSGDDLLAEIRQLRDHAVPIKASLVLSCAYCVQAKKELKNNNRELAWSYLSDARYWCAALYTDTGIVDKNYNYREVSDRADFIALKDKLNKEAQVKTASSGGKGRSKKLQLVIDETYRLAMVNKPPINGWPSMIEAAKKIAPEVSSFAKNKIEFKNGGPAISTIFDWLSDMPNDDKARLFPNVKQSKSSPVKPA